MNYPHGKDVISNTHNENI